MQINIVKFLLHLRKLKKKGLFIVQIHSVKKKSETRSNQLDKEPTNKCDACHRVKREFYLTGSVEFLES